MSRPPNTSSQKPASNWSFFLRITHITPLPLFGVEFRSSMWTRRKSLCSPSNGMSRATAFPTPARKTPAWGRQGDEFRGYPNGGRDVMTSEILAYRVFRLLTLRVYSHES